MTSETKGMLVNVCLGALNTVPLVLAVFLIGVSKDETRDVRQEAVDRGHAEWHKTEHGTQFKWKETK